MAVSDCRARTVDSRVLQGVVGPARSVLGSPLTVRTQSKVRKIKLTLIAEDFAYKSLFFNTVQTFFSQPNDSNRPKVRGRGTPAQHLTTAPTSHPCARSLDL